MVSKLSQLADLIEEDSVPGWLKRQLSENLEAILHELDEKGEVSLRGPSGEEIRIGKSQAASQPTAA